MERRSFLQGAFTSAVFAELAWGETPKLEEATIAELSRYPARDLTESCLARIRELDRPLRSVIEINPDETPLSAHVDL